jgi:acid phosphatase
MVGVSTLLKSLPFVAGSAFASVTYPVLPKDLTTPHQQRLAVYGPNGNSPSRKNSVIRLQDHGLTDL